MVAGEIARRVAWTAGGSAPKSAWWPGSHQREEGLEPLGAWQVRLQPNGLQRLEEGGRGTPASARAALAGAP